MKKNEKKIISISELSLMLNVNRYKARSYFSYLALSKKYEINDLNLYVSKKDIKQIKDTFILLSKNKKINWSKIIKL